MSETKCSCKIVHHGNVNLEVWHEPEIELCAYHINLEAENERLVRRVNWLQEQLDGRDKRIADLEARNKELLGELNNLLVFDCWGFVNDECDPNPSDAFEQGARILKDKVRELIKRAEGRE